MLDRSGSVAIEFAIISPLFILLVLGVVAYGIYFGAANSVQQLAADAARASIAGVNDTERAAIVHAYVMANSDDYIFIDSKKIATTVVPAAASSQYDVSVRYDSAALPLWNLYLPLPVPQKVITRKSTIRIGGL